MADGTGVLILGDVSGGELGSTTLELLAAGQKVASDLGEDLSVALLGDTLDAAAQQAIAHGAQKVYAVTTRCWPSTKWTSTWRPWKPFAKRPALECCWMPPPMKDVS